MRLKIVALAIVLCASSAQGLTASAAKVKAKRQYLTIPLLYVTDRGVTKKGFGPQRKIETINSIDELHFGQLNYSLETPARQQEISDQQKLLGWSKSLKEREELVLTKPLNSVKNHSDFAETVINTAKESGSDEVFVMVHGFNTPFERAAQTAASLAYFVQRPVILYSWPSKGKFSQYDVDLGNNEWSQEHFDAMLDELKRVKEKGLKLTLVAHSMGNRLAVRSAPVLEGKHIFKQMFLVDPDFDAETFVHYLIRYAKKRVVSSGSNESVDKEEPTRVRILFSHKDRALPLSEFLFGGYTRLGQAADKLLGAVISPDLIPEKQLDPQDPEAKKDETKMSQNAPSWRVDFEWIDFTLLDHGVFGHTIPFELIANVWSKDQAGEGYKLVKGYNGAPNKLSTLFMRVFGEKDHVSSKLGTALRVVSSSDPEPAISK